MTMQNDDFVLPFEIERTGLRGRVVRLGPAVDLVLKRHAYPPLISRLLGEALALACCLASTLKFDDGVFTLQARGNGGPVRMLVADMTSEGEFRGYVGFDAAMLEDFGEDSSAASLFGGGHVAFTVDQGADFERYQGIVELRGENLSESVHHYFRQSEQIATALKVACDLDMHGHWRSTAVMVQKLPDEVVLRAAPEDAAELVEADEGYRTAAILLGSATPGEMTDPAILAEELLLRLFHEDGVRVYDKRQVYSGCRCNLDRVEEVLRQFGREQVDEFKVDGLVTVTCEFCTKERVFDDEALNDLYAE
jgi:molecular chaperone Hsp33